MTIGVLILIMVGLYFVMTRQAPSRVQSYDQCVAAGYPATLSYPSTCRAPDGRVFTQEVPPVEKPDLLPVSPSESGSINSYNECVAAGYPSTLSYPATCRTPDGQVFTQQIE